MLAHRPILVRIDGAERVGTGQLVELLAADAAHRPTSSLRVGLDGRQRRAGGPRQRVAELGQREPEAAGGRSGRDAGHLGNLAVGVALEVRELDRAALLLRQRGEGRRARPPPRCAGAPPPTSDSGRCAGAIAHRRRPRRPWRGGAGRGRSRGCGRPSGARRAGIRARRRTGRSCFHTATNASCTTSSASSGRPPRAGPTASAVPAYRSYSSPSACAWPARMRSASRASSSRSSVTPTPIRRTRGSASYITR